MAATATPRAAATRVRFLVLIMGVLLAGVTYLDRVCISMLAPAMSRDLGLTDFQMSFVFSAFTLAYAAFEIPTGMWGDRIGTRRVLTRIVVWWSTFTMLTAAAFNYASLLVVRFLFGAGEAGAWPNAARTFSRWFPARERGAAQGVFFMGAHGAGGLTPILVTAMLTVMPWRAVFVVFGVVGFVWAAAWFLWFRDEPREHKWVNPAELEWIERGRAAADSHALKGDVWRRLFRSRSLLALCVMYFTQSYGFYFYITWLPTYLARERGFQDLALGAAAGLPLLLSVLADGFGGLTTDFLSRRFGLRLGRAVVGVASFAVASAAMLVGTASSDANLAAALLAIALAASNFPLGACWAACSDIGGNRAGLVGACMNTSGQIGGILSPIIVASVVKYFSDWTAPLYLTGGLYLIGAAAWFFVDPRKPVWGGD